MGKNVRKSQGGIFLTHTVVSSTVGCLDIHANLSNACQRRCRNVCLSKSQLLLREIEWSYRISATVVSDYATMMGFAPELLLGLSPWTPQGSLWPLYHQHFLLPLTHNTYIRLFAQKLSKKFQKVSTTNEQDNKAASYAYSWP